MNKVELAQKIKQAAYLEGDFILSSGRHSKYYLDKYLFETKPEILKPLVAEMAKMTKDLKFDRIAGPEIGAITLAAALSLETGKPFIILRKEPKKYGTSKFIEGEIKAGEKILLVEDILTTGTQAIAAAQKIKEAGAEVVLLLGVIDREEGAREAIGKAGLAYKAVFAKSELGI